MDEEPGRTDPFVEAVSRFIDERALLAPKGGIVVGVSGGADSVALLDVLRELSRRQGWAYHLTIAHMNHLLRDTAEADAAFVADLAASLDIPCIVKRQDVAAEARRTGQGVEQAGRSLRYAFLRDAAVQAGAPYVAVGHHADDNAETILYRIVRGTHLRGLSGMPASRLMEGSPVTLVRPLLSCRRAEIEGYCRRRSLSWRTDPTNADTRYRRNFIRHELLPLLREHLTPLVDDALHRLAGAAAEAEAFLADLASGVILAARKDSSPRRSVLDAGLLADHKPILRRYALRAELERLGAPMRAVDGELLSRLAELADQPPPAAVALPGGFVARREGLELIVEAPQEAAGPSRGSHARAAGPKDLPLDCPGRTVLDDGRAILCQVQPLDAAAFENHCRTRPDGVELLDADKVSGHLVCRYRRPGDTFRPLGCPGMQSVSDFLTNRKLPHRLREGVLCICDDAGIVYAAPLRIDDRVRITPATTRVLRIEIQAPKAQMR